MHGSKISFAIFYLYPIVYGIIIMVGIAILFNQTPINEILDIISGTSFSKIFILADNLQRNFYLLLVFVILTIVEVVRAIILDAKEVLLIEAFLLLIYTWSILVTLTYFVFTYIIVKLLQSFISTKVIQIKNNIIVKPKTFDVKKFRGLLFLSIGSTILIHIGYSYFMPIKILSLLFYISILVAINIATHKLYPETLTPLYIIITAIPPFGILPAVQRAINVKKTTDN
jgi:hypothetical protein